MRFKFFIVRSFVLFIYFFFICGIFQRNWLAREIVVFLMNPHRKIACSIEPELPIHSQVAMTDEKDQDISNAQLFFFFFLHSFVIVPLRYVNKRNRIISLFAICTFLFNYEMKGALFSYLVYYYLLLHSMRISSLVVSQIYWNTKKKCIFFCEWKRCDDRSINGAEKTS